MGAALVGVAAWQAGSLSVGLLLSGGFVATAVVLHVCGLALVWAIQPLRYARSFALRQAVLHMVRPGNQTRVILLAVGLGAFFILGVRALQANLLRDFAVQAGPNAPDMFLVDIQPGQRDQVAAVADQANGDRPAPRPIPVLRARVVAVKGANVALENYEQVRGRSGLSREFTVTYREKPRGERAGDRGAAGGSPASKGVEVSIEEGLLATLADRRRRRDDLRRAGPADHGARVEHPPGGVGGLPRRRLHVRVQARARSTARRTPTSPRCAARPTPTRARGCRRASSRSSPTCR